LLSERIEALGSNARGVATDVCNEAAVQAAVNAALEHFGALHGLVNCAGVASGERILGRQGPHGLESFNRVIGLNLIGMFNMLRLAAEAIAKGEPDERGNCGVIINTASIAAYDGQIGQAAYAASKGGVVAMTLPAARELARYGIRVMTIAPGVFEMPMMVGMTQKSATRWPPACRFRRAWADRANMPHWCARSARTTCSTAKSFASTARCAWPPNDGR
jgi:NAD(P)-dependent dehydrogenase (short-subunit alcohol dehydrogenase family)